MCVFPEQHPHHSSLKEEVSDVVRQKKKYLKKPKLECVVTPQPLAEPLPVLSKSDIKQYDFHSSDEDEFPQVSTKISLGTRQKSHLAGIWLIPTLNRFKSSLYKLKFSFQAMLCSINMVVHLIKTPTFIINTVINVAVVE